MLSELNSKVVNLIKMKIDQNIYDQILLDLNGYTEGHTQKLIGCLRNKTEE